MAEIKQNMRCVHAGVCTLVCACVSARVGRRGFAIWTVQADHVTAGRKNHNWDM